MSTIRVKVPATTANLGPGFDALGIALQIYNTVLVSPSDQPTPDPMAAAAAEKFFQIADIKPFGFHWQVRGEVPRSRGMGSSVTVRLGILHGLNALAGSPLNDEAIFRICAELEGHPDNAAPAAFGGFVVARSTEKWLRFPVGKKLRFVLLIPDFEIATPDARRVLPKEIPLSQAAMSAGNAAFIAAAFASKQYQVLRNAFHDGIHQPYRLQLLPVLHEVIEAGIRAGAIGGWLSGSGSTICCLTENAPKEVAAAMLEAARMPQAKTLITRADNKGVRVRPS